MRLVSLKQTIIVFLVPRRCLTNPCRNGGQCIEGQSLTICKCKGGFYGQFCEGKLQMILFTCKFRFQTVPTNVTFLDIYLFFWSTDNVCHPNPCFNKATCSILTLPDKTSTYKCGCKPTFAGKRCQGKYYF